MQHIKKLSILLIVLLLSVSLSLSSLAAAPMSFDEWTSDWETHVSGDGKIALTPGRDETEMNFAWVTFLTDTDAAFRYGRQADLSDAVDAEITITRAPTMYYNHKVTLTDLTPGTWYYAFKTAGAWQETASFVVGNPSNSFQVMFCSDVQTGRSGDEKLDSVLQNDSYGWYTTLNAANTVAPDYSFILSAGDQVQTATVKKQYNLLLAPEYMKSTPIATALGNHDFASSLYNHHFNNPNSFKDTTLSQGGYPYYFAYGDALFIVLDSNLSLSGDHDEVMFAAVNAYPDAKWRVALLHHSIYSKFGTNSNTGKLAPLFDKYSVDLVLSGHDHIYTRTQPLQGGNIVSEGGTVYMSAGSASGSNTSHTDNMPDYIAATYDFYDPSFSILDFAEGGITIKTYQSDNMELVDEYVLEKDTSEPAGIPARGASFLYKSINWIARKIIAKILYYIPIFGNYEPVI